MEVMLLFALVGGVGLAIAVMVVLYRAISNVFDWVVYNLGNEEAVRRKKQQLEGTDEPEPDVQEERRDPNEEPEGDG